MERLALDAVEPEPSTGAGTAHHLSEALGTDDVAMNFYTVAPGERVSGLHAHGDQEELFVVLEGTATIETLDGTTAFGPREVVRFAPGEYQSVGNEHDAALELLALGAPPGAEDLRIPLACPECAHEFRRPTVTDSGPGLRCPSCGAQMSPNCPDCGSQRLHAVLGPDGDPVSKCVECGAITEH